MDREQRLVPIGPAGKRGCYQYRCSCGRIVMKNKYSVTIGHTKSCGCLMREINAKRFLKHGASVKSGDRRLFDTWVQMRQRCSNENNGSYVHYGARGIRVCERWEITDSGEHKLRASFDWWAKREGRGILFGTEY